MLVSPTAASFGLSAQVGSRVPQGPTRVLQGFHQGFTAMGWSGVPPAFLGFCEGSTKFCAVGDKGFQQFEGYGVVWFHANIQGYEARGRLKSDKAKPLWVRSGPDQGPLAEP